MIVPSTPTIGYSGIGMWAMAAAALLVVLAAVLLLSLLVALALLWIAAVVARQRFSLQDLALLVTFCCVVAGAASFGYWQLCLG